ncbi:MAG: hypothetical protein ACREDR_33580 [Blastocatellia bacterium]
MMKPTVALLAVCLFAATVCGQQPVTQISIPPALSGNRPMPQEIKPGHFLLHSSIPSLDALGRMNKPLSHPQAIYPPVSIPIWIPIDKLPPVELVVKDGALYITMPGPSGVALVPMPGGGASGCIPGARSGAARQSIVR